MKNLEELIQELCPDGVEFVKFKDCCDYIRGITYNKSKEENISDAPAWNVLRANNITLSNNQLNFNDVKRVSIEVKVKESQKLKKGDILICAGSGSKDHIGKVAYIEDDIDYTFGGFMAVIRSTSVNTRFLFHILTGNSFKQYLSLALNSSTINNLNSSVMGNFEFPLPPIEVQTEIVRILDKFTSLEAELEAELDCRKRQYEYYRDKLLSFDNVGGQEVEWKKMSEVGTFIRGNGLQKKDFTESGVGCIHYGQLYTHYGTSATETITYCSSELAKKLRKAAKGDIVIATTSENVEDVCKAVAWLGEEEIAVSGDAFIYKHTQNPKYMAYLFQTASFFIYKKKKATGTKVIRLTGDAMGNYLAPIPSLEEQNRIVSILDRFESLTTSLQSGLPAEIAARRQQYEYYRDKLLTFKRKGAA